MPTLLNPLIVTEVDGYNKRITSNFQWDTLNITYPDTVTEIYTYKLLSTTVQVITLVYSDATKSQLTSVTKV